MFRNRQEAGRRLAKALAKYRGAKNTLVLGLARGGVVVGDSLSRELGLPLEVFIVQKLRAPDNPELAVGAVTETGAVFTNLEMAQVFHMTPTSIAAELEDRKQEIAVRRELYRAGAALPALRGKTVLLVDDGAATGETFLAAVESLRPLKPKEIVAALPVAPLAVLAAIETSVNSLCVLEAPENMGSVGVYYEEFDPVPHPEVIRLLSESSARAAPTKP